MTQQVKWSVMLLGGAAIIAALMIFLRPAPSEDTPVAEAPLVETVPLEAASGAIPVLASGIVQPREEIVVGVQVAGRLTYVHPGFREGGVLPAGATVLRIDPAEFRNDVRMARADVAAQDVAVLQAREEVAIAREEWERFSARESSIAADPGRTEILPPRELAGENPPRDGAEIAAGQDSAASAGLVTREPQLRSAEAARERAAAGLADAQLLLSRTRITAPFRGLVQSADAAAGSLVQPAQALGTLVSTSAYEVRISLTPDEAALIPGLLSSRSGRIAASVVYSFGGRTYRWPAFVDRANAILDSATRNVEVFLLVPSPLSAGRLAEESDETSLGQAPPLLLGAFVNAEISGASLDSYAAIPANSLRPGNEVWVVREGALRVLPVRVIQRSDELAYVTTPSLAEGGALVTSNLNAPIEGMAVRMAGSPSE